MIFESKMLSLVVKIEKLEVLFLIFFLSVCLSCLFVFLSVYLFLCQLVDLFDLCYSMRVFFFHFLI